MFTGVFIVLAHIQPLKLLPECSVLHGETIPLYSIILSSTIEDSKFFLEEQSLNTSSGNAGFFTKTPGEMSLTCRGFPFIYPKFSMKRAFARIQRT
jgi:hypothetical protein